MNIKDKVTVITGASSGIGALMAMELSAKGAIPILLARSVDKLNGVASKLQGEHAVMTLDVTDAQRVQQTMDQVIDKYGCIDILINNAGYGVFKKLEDTSLEMFEEMMNVNYMGTVRCTKAVLPSMLRAGRGHIVNIASLAGKFGSAKSSGYSATKHAVVGFSSSLRQELAGTGVLLTVINPGPMDTPFLEQADPTGNYVKNVAAFMLKPEKVVREIIDAIERNIPEKNLPRITSLGIILSHLFPRTFNRIATRMFNKK